MSSDTRHTAYEAARERAAGVEAKIIRVLKGYPEGLTPDQMATAIGESILTVRPACTKLKQAGHISDTGTRRRNRSGKKAAVLAITTRPPAPAQKELF